MLSERWRSFLEKGEQEGTLAILGPDGDRREVEYLAKGNVLPARNLLVLHDKAANPATGTQQKTLQKQSPNLVQDYALFLLDVDGRIAAWYAGAVMLIGFFEDIDTERGIGCRMANSLSLRQFLGYGIDENTPGHVTIWRTRRLREASTHKPACHVANLRNIRPSPRLATWQTNSPLHAIRF